MVPDLVGDRAGPPWLRLAVVLVAAAAYLAVFAPTVVAAEDDADPISLSTSATPLLVMPVGDSITRGYSSAPEPQGTYRMYLYDHLVASGLEPGSALDFVGPRSTHPSGDGYLRQGLWDHDALAVAGWRTTNTRDAIADAVATFDPDVLLVLVGVNDFLLDDRSPQEATNNVSTLISNARTERSEIKVVLAEIPPTNPERNVDADIVAYNGLLRELATSATTENSPVVTVDLYTGFNPAAYHHDGLHPNPIGDEFIASRFADVLYTEFGIGAPWNDPNPDPDPVPTFSDVPLDHPFFVEIESLAEQDVIRGFGDGTFRPTVDVTRQAAVAFLYRVAGEPAVTFSQEFDDVGPEHPFAIEITWAVQEGVTTGFPDGTFRPTDTVTRRASSALLFRFAGEPAGDFAASAAAAFTDVTTDTAFANEIGWMVDAGITTGFPDDTFRPGISVTRQAQAAFLYRYQQL